MHAARVIAKVIAKVINAVSRAVSVVCSSCVGHNCRLRSLVHRHGKLSDRGRAVQRGQWQALAQLVLDAAEDRGGLHGTAAEREEIVVGADRVQVEFFAEEFGKPGFRTLLRRSARAASRLVPRGQWVVASAVDQSWLASDPYYVIANLSR
ncbi:MAG: hypothetical protein R3F24_01940 [Gammaproteobacteria bacterium]